MRTGLIARKIGMSTLFNETGNAIAVTILHIDNKVIGSRSLDKNGYNSLIMKFGTAKLKSVGKSVRGQYSKNGIEPGLKIKEFRITEEKFLPIGTDLNANFFEVGSYVDVTGTSKGKGFQGVMKRHNFSGLRASHGVSLTHRSGGSTGQCQDPGKVNKGKKMAGHMGDKRTSIQNLQIVKIDEARSLIFVKGAVPGGVKSLLLVKDAIKKRMLG